MPIVVSQEQDQEQQGMAGAGQQPVMLTSPSSSTIESQPTQPQQRKQQGSGFTNVQKYAQANQGAAQKIAGAAQQNIQSQAQSIGQQVQKQQQSFNEQLAQNRQRIEQAKQFGQQAIQRAAGVENVADLQSQQQNLQQRLQQVQQPQQPVPEQEVTQQDVENLQQQYNQQEQARQQAIQQVNTQRGQANIQDVVQQRESLEQPLTQTRQQLQEKERQLEAQQFNQKLGQRKQQIEQELSSLEQRLASNNPLTPDEINRFRNILTEKEVFDSLSYDDRGAERQAQQLQQLTSRLGTEQGRKEALRQTFLGQSPTRQYTRGQTTLDQLLLQTNQPVLEQFVQQGKQAGLSSEELAREARRQSLREMAGLSTEAQQLRTGLESGVGESQQALISALEQRQQTGEGSRLQQLKQAFDQGLLSQEQANLLGLTQGQTYGVNVSDLLKDYQGLTTRESVGSLSNLAQAQALSKLAGEVEQNIFANPNLVGQLSSAERYRLEDVRGRLADEQKKRMDEIASAEFQRNRMLGTPREGANTVEPQELAARANSQNLISMIDQANKDNVVTSQELQNIMNSDSAKAFGNLDEYALRDKNLVNLRNQLLGQRIQVEGTQDVLVKAQQQEALDKELARRDLLNAIAQSGEAGAEQFGEWSLDPRTMEEIRQSNLVQERLRAASPSANIYGARSPEIARENLLEAYNKITGRNLFPTV